jgi:hypothetical protein
MLDQELDEELRYHIECRTEQNIVKGMTPQEARRAALLEIGGVEKRKEECRDARKVNWVQDLAQDVRYGLRILRKTPGFTVVAILALALGIGANVAIFTVVHTVLLQPLPFSHPEQLVRVYDDISSSNTHDVGMSVPELWDLRDHSGVFQDITALVSADANLTGGDQPERIELLGTNANYFTMLGAHARLGRTYTPADAPPGFSDPVVISDGFWRRAFGGDPQVLGSRT